MITRPEFAVEPWSVRESGLQLDVLAQTESVFALANGHIGLRGTLDEGEPAAMPGTYLNGFHEVRPLPYAERAYGNPEAGQTVVNVTDAKVIRLLVDDELFDVRYGRVLAHERELDLRAGVLRRRTEWCSPAHRTVRVRSTRLVSFVQRATAAIVYEVEPVDGPARIVLQSELIANEPGAEADGDPRAAAALRAPLQAEDHQGHDALAILVHSTKASGLRMAAGMDHEVDGPADTGMALETYPDIGRVTVTATLEPGQTLRLVKFLAYGWSARRSLPSVRAQVGGALAEARHTGWDGLLASQREYLDAFWDGADVELDGDADVQQAIRFALFQVLQAGARAEERAIPAKGLTGPGYDGHAFWDTESFVLPVLTYTAPKAAASALRWRHTTLSAAEARAGQLGMTGAAFPWRTIDGQECSGYWPAGTAAFHVNADIADAVARYQAAVDDPAFEREAGLELLVGTARLWRSLGHHDGRGHFRIDGVTGPDEYSAIADNNVYTNLMAKRNLLAAADAVARHPEEAAALGADAEETASWRDAAADLRIPYDAHLGVHEQAEAFTRHEPWDFGRTGPEDYPLLLHFPYFDLYRRQVVKQADLVLALHVCGDAFSAEEKARDFAYYERITVRDSSLSACTQAVVAAEVGHLELAHDYLGEAALMDLDDLEHNTRDGLHIASLAGAWIATVAGFGGMRDHGGRLTFAPRLPAGITRLAFRMTWRGQRLRVTVRHPEARYELLDEGPPVEVGHHGETVRLRAGHPETRPVPPVPEGLERPRQPPGREPTPRHPRGGGGG
jgi:alpha,alpha-trehalose phosphorylase